MPAQFRIDQTTPGIGVAGRARHDLVINETITLTATSPAPGPGITFSWEILDKVGTTAVLSASTGQSVTIPGGSLTSRPYGFKVRLTVNDNGVISRTTRVFSCRNAIGLRVPLFGEDAPRESSLAANDPDLSVDNALYSNRAGLGASEQNWRGWAEWGWELVNVINSLSGGSIPAGPAGGDLGGTYPNPQVRGLYGVAIDATAATPSPGDALIYDGTNYKPAPAGGGSGGGTEPFLLVVGNSLEGDTLANCDYLDPGDGTGIVAALAAAELMGSGYGGVVMVRPGVYNLASYEGPIQVPLNVALCGHQEYGTLIIARDNGTDGNTISAFTVEGTLQDIWVQVPLLATNASAGSATAIITVGSEGTCRRVAVSFDGATDITYFGLITSAFLVGGNSLLEDCKVIDLPSYRAFDETDSLVGFDTITGASTTLNQWKMIDCTCETSATYTADIGFRIRSGGGYIVRPRTLNIRETAMQITEEAHDVQVLDVSFIWTSEAEAPRYGIRMGATSGTCDVQFIDVRGGIIDGFGTIGEVTSRGVEVRVPANGILNYFTLMGVTVREWVDGLYMDGHVTVNSFDRNSFVNNKFLGCTEPTTFDNDTNTIFDNNQVD
jgi:hypothetical protein